MDVWRKDDVAMQEDGGDSKSVMMKVKWKEVRCKNLNI